MKLLALHGFRTNVQVLEFQLRGIVKAFPRDTKVYTLNGLYKAKGPAYEKVVEFFGDGPYFEWWNTTIQDMNTKYEGVEESLKYVKQFIKENGPFDVLLGFSQGSILAGILNAHYHLNNTNQCIPWKIVIHSSGLLPRDEMYRKEIQSVKEYTTFQIFLIGRLDELKEQTEELAKVYPSGLKRIYYHDKGHQFPSYVEYKREYHHMAELVVSIISENGKASTGVDGITWS